MYRFFSQSEKMLKIKYYLDRQMSNVYQSVLDAQLEIVSSKMKQYEKELFDKLDVRVSKIGFEFESTKRETQV